jgi:hypothetical protein
MSAPNDRFYPVRLRVFARSLPRRVLGFVACVLLLAATAPIRAESPAPRQSQSELAATFEAAGAVIFEAKTASDFSKFEALREATVSPGANGLRVVASGTDPQVVFPKFAEGKKFILRMVIEAPFETPAQFFYQISSKPGFVEAQSQLVPLKKGKNVVYFNSEDPNVIDPLRIDPGASPGEYVIESVVARSAERK